jgi:superfamily II DNA or RNA helicase
MLYYPELVCKEMKDKNYAEEIDFLVKQPNRNKFIRNLALSLKGNSLVLFNFVDKHGIPLYEDIKANAKPGRKIFYVSGKTAVEDREEIRKITEQEEDAIIVASFGTFAQGISIRKLHNVIFASPSKSRIRVLQSLGRGLRKSKGKERLVLYDISDILQYKSHKNHTMKHFTERMKIYNSEKFDYKMFKVRLKI